MFRFRFQSPQCLVASTMSLVLLSLTTPASATKPALPGTKFEMKYEGGSLKLEQHDKLDIYVATDFITIDQGKGQIKVPVSAITEISYGSDVHRRVGAAVGVAMVTFGIGAMLLLVKTKKHYIGFTWDDKKTDKGGVVMKVGKGDYRGFQAALEGVTGLKSVDTDTAPAKSSPAPAATPVATAAPTPSKANPVLDPSAGTAPSTTSTVPAQREAMTNADVISLVKAGVPQDLIMDQIKRCEPHFSMTTNGLIQLQQGGVSETMVKEMARRQNGGA
jgi:hypothetical protein